MQQKNRSLTLGFLAGALGGALGTVVLNVFQTASLKATEAMESKLDAENTYSKQQKALLGMFEGAHTRTADTVADAAGVDLTRKQRKAAAPVTEFAFGTLCAGVYGALAEYLPAVTAGAGTVYGAALFTGASIVVLPVIGYVPSPKDRTPVQHLGGLAGNMLYGAVTEGVRRGLRRNSVFHSGGS